MVGVGRMTEPNTLGWDSTKWITGSNAIPKTLFRCIATDTTLPTDNLSLLESDAGTLIGQSYEVPVGRVFDLLYGEYNANTTTDIIIGIQANQVQDAVNGTLLWSHYIEGSTSHGRVMNDWYYGGGLHFVAGDFVTPYDMAGAARLEWSFWGWGVESDA